MQTIKTLAFNTGRLYTEHGQRIGAAQLSDGTVAFDDVDRGLYYVTSGPCDLTQAAIMRAYDYNQTEGRRYGNDALTDEIKNAIRAAAYAARSLKPQAEPEPEPAPAAPALPDAEPVQTEIEFDDGVDSHDYVVTGCHDEDNTEPETDAHEKARKVWSAKLAYALSTGAGDDEAYAYADKETAAYRARNEPAPAASQAPETRSPIEWLRLTRDVANPRRDRRMKYGWQSVDTFKAGTIFEVWPDSDGGRAVWFGTMGIGDLKLESALIDAGEPTIGQDFEEIKKIAGHGYALGSNVIDYALAQGWLTRDQILQALAAGAAE